MLLPLLVNFWWFPLMVVNSWPCSDEQMVQSTLTDHSTTHLTGWILNFNFDEPQILHHPCANCFLGEVAPAVYLGEKVFISIDRFGSSLLPLTIPQTLTASPALVSDAEFIMKNRVLLVINNNVFIYLYNTWQIWIQSRGITKPVTQISTYACCSDENDSNCDKISSLVLAFTEDNWASKTDIFYSDDGGILFHLFTSRPREDAIVLDMYNFAFASEIGILLKPANDSKIAYVELGHPYFYLSDKGAHFNLEYWRSNKVDSIAPPGMRGFIITWTTEILLSSPNRGLTAEPVVVIPTNSYPYTSLPTRNNSVCWVVANTHEIATFTKSQLFYGNLDAVNPKMVHLGDKNPSMSNDTCDVIMFEDIGTISFITPVPSTESSYYHFHKCKIKVQDRLMKVQPALDPCPVEILSGDFHNKMYYMDKKEKLYINATFVPKPGTDAHLYVTVGNPRALSFEAQIVEGGYTMDGSTLFILQIMLEEQKAKYFQERTNTSFFIKLSSISVDIYNKGIFCIDMHPLVAVVGVTCPPRKHIRISKKVTACDKDLFEPRLLQKLVYSIDKDLYDPEFLGRKELDQKDLEVKYELDKWGCPILVYYHKPWLPGLELWDGDTFLKYVSADFVLFEIHGMHNYDYHLNEVEANCLSKAQSWTTLLNDSNRDPVSAWTDYVSCKKRRGNDSLPSARNKYHILNMNEDNRILFSQYNGFYIFTVLVVDPLYSYCKFKTTFSVYVYGALPQTEINAGKALVSFLVLIFGTILMVYYFPKLLRENARMKLFQPNVL